MDKLGEIPLLAGLCSADLDVLERVAFKHTYRNRTTIFHQATPCNGLYIVNTGIVKLSLEHEGKEHLIAFLRSGEILDPIPLLDGGPYSLSAHARGSTCLYFISADDARELIWEHPSALEVLLRCVAERMRKLTALTSELALKDVSGRVCRVLMDLAQSEGQPLSDGVNVQRTLTQTEFASLAGTAREVAWRSLKHLEQAGVIRISRREFTILDAARLERMA